MKVLVMSSNAPVAPETSLQIPTFDGSLGRRIIETHVWAVREGLNGASAHDLFDGYCQRLVIHGVPLWRAFTATETLHPQWSGYGYTWRRDINAIQPDQYVRSNIAAPEWLRSPAYSLICRARKGELHPVMRRRLETGPEQRDFLVLDEFFAEGATDYFAQVFSFGRLPPSLQGETRGDPSQGTGTFYSFMADRPGGFHENDIALLQSTLPGLSLAVKSHAGHAIASALLRTYLGEETGRRVRAGAIERGSVEGIHAVLWYADIRRFTTMTDSLPGPVIIDLLNNVFEGLTAPLRSRGGEVLKFLGDGMLAALPFEEGNRVETCRRALDAAAETMRELAAVNARAPAGSPHVTVDLALHVGEVLYGNVGAADRLDFTVIGPAVNEVARIEALCEPLGRMLLISTEFAAAVEGVENRLKSLGHYNLRGVRETKKIFALASDGTEIAARTDDDDSTPAD
jgi:adenylate cyclase